jgi:ABC-2 type transport system ATP-binding protein
MRVSSCQSSSASESGAIASGTRIAPSASIARRRLERLDIPLDRHCGRLSGGQQAQVALAVAVAKRPEVLLLDEPVARLDPLARREFLEALMETVAESGVTVVLSSHLISDLERVCDYLIVLTDARVQLAGDVDDLLASHYRLTGPRRDPASLPSDQQVIEASHTDRQSTFFVRCDGPILDPAWTVEPVGLEDLVLAYMRHAGVSDRVREPHLGAVR